MNNRKNKSKILCIYPGCKDSFPTFWEILTTAKDCFSRDILLMYTYIYQILINGQTMHFANIISNFLPIMLLLAIDGFNVCKYK